MYVCRMLSLMISQVCHHRSKSGIGTIQKPVILFQLNTTMPKRFSVIKHVTTSQFRYTPHIFHHGHHAIIGGFPLVGVQFFWMRMLYSGANLRVRNNKCSTLQLLKYKTALKYSRSLSLIKLQLRCPKRPSIKVLEVQDSFPSLPADPAPYVAASLFFFSVRVKFCLRYSIARNWKV